MRRLTLITKFVGASCTSICNELEPLEKGDTFVTFGQKFENIRYGVETLDFRRLC